MQGAPPLGHTTNFGNNYQQPQQGNAFGMPQANSGGFPGASSNDVGVARFNGQMPGGGMVAPRPGAAPMSNPNHAVGPQGRVGLGAMGTAASRPGAVMQNGPRGPMATGAMPPMGSAPTSMAGLTVGGGAPVGSSGMAPGRPSVPQATPGYNPSGEILAMLGKGPPGTISAGTTPKLQGAVAPGGSDEHELPHFGVEDFPALGGGGMGTVPLHRQVSGDGLGPNMGGIHGPGMSGIAAAKLPQDFQMASEDFPALPGLGSVRGPVEEGMEKLDLGMPPQPQQPGGHLMQGAQAAHGGQGQIIPPGGLGGAVRRPGGFEMPTGVTAKGGMHPDRFGLLGLLSVIQMTNPDLNTLALGTDLTTLGLNLNSTESLYSTFASPWADGPSRREPEFSLPMCYYMQLRH